MQGEFARHRFTPGRSKPSAKSDPDAFHPVEEAGACIWTNADARASTSTSS